MKILAIAASLRKGSFNKSLISIASDIARKNDCTVDVIDFSEFDMPLYSGDVEENKGVPEGALKLKKKIESYDAVIISSPEYNYSVPGVLKNAIDWTSRIKPQPFRGKNILLMSASPSMVGGNRGLWSLRMPLEALGAFVYPEMFSLAVAHEILDSSGKIKDESISALLENNVKGFIKTVKGNQCK